MKTTFRRIVALLLIAAMLLSFAGCQRQTSTAADTPAVETAPTQTTQPAKPQTPEEAIEAAGELVQAQQTMDLTGDTEYDRDSMEEIADLLGAADADVKNMNDAQIFDFIEDQLTADKAPAGKDPVTDAGKPDAPAVDADKPADGFAEDGSLTKPFDQIYPELVAEGAVEYDDKTLLIKMANSRNAEITKAMSDAGVALLEVVVPMQESTWYVAKLFPGADALKAVSLLRELEEIQTVDLNYEVETAGMADAQAIPEEIEINPDSNKQWHLKYCQYPQGHGQIKKKGGDPSVIVAVIDSGVDYDHEDLAQNIWKNTGETPDDGIDNDDNGYIDDYYGVNIITGEGNGDDDNGHGTHVAGIIAAQNNNIGVVGLAYNVKIMPIKAAMSSGALLQSDIAKAVYYAYEHGAQVINMSFGGTASSIAVQDALEVAYSQCVLVASAGNDGAINEFIGHLPVIPNYPAALNYVIGVMSVNEAGIESGFTNYDGMLFSTSEYEVYAPGEGILSTIPGDRYASWSGTSMAAPVVSAIAAILRSEWPDMTTYPTKYIYGQITATSSNGAVCCDPEVHGPHNVPGIVNLYEALNKTPTPDVGLYDFAQFDTAGFEQDAAGKNNGDGVIDAGETIALGLTLRNRWGKAVETAVTIDTLSPAGMADPYIEILNPTVNYGEIGTYSTANCGAIYTDEMLTAWQNPFYIHIKEDCPNDYIFKLNVHITAKNGLKPEDTKTYANTGTITLTVRSGKILPSVIEEDMTLTADNLYIIPNGTTILAGATVTVEPGTHIQFWSNDPTDPYADDYIASLKVMGRFLVNGTKEDMVYIYPSELMSAFNVQITQSDGGYVSLRYADITNFGAPGYNSNVLNIAKADHCIFRQNYTWLYNRQVSGSSVSNYTHTEFFADIGLASSCVFYRIGSENSTGYPYLYGRYSTCAFADCDLQYKLDYCSLDGCIFLGNSSYNDLDAIHSAYGNSRFSSAAVNVYADAKEYGERVYYDRLTGTTYVWYDDSLPRAARESILKQVQQMGGGYAVINTPEEKAFIDAKVDYIWNIFAGYDQEADRMVWSDGTPIADYLDPDNAAAGYSNCIRYGYGSITSSYLLSACLFEIPGEVYPDDITLNSYEITLPTNECWQIVPAAVPATDTFLYESTDETVATVDENGLVMPVAPGTADIRVYSWNKDLYNYVTVHVTEHTAAVPVGINAVYQLTPAFAPAAEAVQYTSDNEAVATVDENGLVTPVGPGTAVIRMADAAGTRYSVVTVTVGTQYVEFFTNETHRITQQLLPATETLRYVSKDETVVTVDENGLVTPVAAGEAEIEVYHETLELKEEPAEGAEPEYETVRTLLFAVHVTVHQFYPLTDLIIPAAEAEQWIILGNTGVITPAPVPANATLTGPVTFTSSDESIVSVTADGILTATGRGTAAVTVACDGVEKTVTVHAGKAATALALDKDMFTAGLADGDIALPAYTADADADIYALWSSSDEDVATVTDGKLRPVGTGTTSIILRDAYTGLSASAVLCVVEGDLPIFTKFVTASSYNYYALAQNGDVYTFTWSMNGPVYELFMQDVADLDAAGSYSIFLKKDGTVHRNYSYKGKPELLTEFFVGKDPVRVETANIGSGVSFWTLTADGCVYAWGRNDYGILGLGSSESYISQPTLINLEGIRDIHQYDYQLLLLNEQGQVFMTGHASYSYSSPHLIDSEVLAFTHESGVWVKQDSVAGIGWNSVYRTDLSQYDQLIYVSNHSCLYAVKDGALYLIQYGTITPLATDAAVTALHVNANYYGAPAVVATADGMLYCYDSTGFAPVYPTFAGEDITLTGTSLTAENVLTEEPLVLSFSKELRSEGFGLALYADDSQIPVAITAQHNQIILSRAAGFEPDVTYRVEISAGGLTGLVNTANSQPITVTFTAAGTGTETTPDIDTDIDTGEDVIIHTAVRDESIVRFYWTADLFNEQFGVYTTDWGHASFYGNAVLNRLSTDTDVTHWLRFVAPSGNVTQSISFGSNYWGTTNEALIAKQIVDSSDFSSYRRLLWENYLTTPPENTFPFVTGVTLYNKAGEATRTVGAEEITVEITFNRDMDTTIPLRVTFGSAAPYADYTIEGSFTDARTWQGTYTVSTLIEGGENYFNIANGCSATDDLMLCEDTARFGFTIDSTAAQALLMQGYATDTGIQLSWTQDDFDTLMGYNVYRSTSEDGYYQRVNDTVIPADQKEFFDDTVEPGKLYYYNFTVVQTDMTESIPSGKIALMSKDTMAPNVYHSPVRSAFTGSNLIISATVTDNLSLSAVKVYYRTVGAEDWNIALMNKLNDKYSAIIPASLLSTDGLEYYIEAFDGINYTCKGTAEQPYTVTVQQAIDVSSLGDVNCDGKITALDALLVLQAINDKYNMNSEEFVRADLDGNGVLETFEALRILQYANGSVGSVVIG